MMEAAVRTLGESREVTQLRGMARAMLPQWEADPSNPCWLGERLSSALIAGSRMPKVFSTINDDTLENIQMHMTVHRYLL